MKNNLYIDINVLQTVPASNINRDETGAPKTALYGGVSRARVSSQSWKRAVRKAFAANCMDIGIRTEKFPQLLIDKICELDANIAYDDAVNKATTMLDKAPKKKNGKAVVTKIKKVDNTHYQSKSLFMVSTEQVEKLAQYAITHDTVDNDEARKKVKAILKSSPSIDIALFGRMVADNPELNVDAATQVAHALSTHEVVPEFDYYTALDDEKEPNQNGAAMLGMLEFNSATLYRYANINFHELSRNLGSSDAVAGVISFIKAFLLSMPSGKQNTFANKTLPSYVMVTIRPDTPVNLVSAFENPIVSKSGYMEKSERRLEDEYQKIANQELVEKPLLNAILGDYNSTVGQQVATLPKFLDVITENLEKAVRYENAGD